MNVFQWVYLGGLLIFWAQGIVILIRDPDSDDMGWFMLAGLLWPMFLPLMIWAAWTEKDDR